MELRRGWGGEGSVPKLALLFLISLCLFVACVLIAEAGSRGACLDIGCSRADSHTQGERWRSGEATVAPARWAVARRRLWGPGSYPPRCAGKCGKCTPCKAVHVPVPPGTPVTTEYYPEAWRCKCGNRLYMP